MSQPAVADPLSRLEALNAIGVGLSKERDLDRLLEAILLAAKRLTNADAGTLYRLGDDAHLHFAIVRTDSLGIQAGGSAAVAPNLPPIPLWTADGDANDAMVVAYAVHHRCTVALADAYEATQFDFRGTRAFDAMTGYRSRSFLTVPLQDHEGEVLGVLQLINAIDRATGEVVPFSTADERLLASLASQAATAWTNRRLLRQLEDLFESFLNLLNVAIDEKSPHTGGHCQRVPELTMLLAEAASSTATGPLADFVLDPDGMRELRLAALLHDCGKVTTPVHIVDKATKLAALHDRIEEIARRFDVASRDLELEQLRTRSDVAARSRAQAALRDDLLFLRRCNLGAETMADADVARVHAIASRTWHDGDGNEHPFLSGDEVENLTVRRGTLTPADRRIIEQHASTTHRMLTQLPWPARLVNVPEIAASHHERLDGKGYPRGLDAARLTMQARILAIADVFEALTAKDRPYKPARPVSEALRVLARMASEGALDPDLLAVFIDHGVWLRYARQHLDPAQIDIAATTLAAQGFTPPAASSSGSACPAPAGDRDFDPCTCPAARH
jgi:HD-GYP domain-containing protein (c-di-GMP phosphodiesterase class II)